MSERAMQEHYDSPEQRLQKRRARRWKRRARMVGPFLGVPVLLATLALSVDLIEYQPVPQKERLSDRPIPTAVVEKQQQRSIRTRTSVSTASVIASSPLQAEASAAQRGNDSNLDLTLGAEPPPPARRGSARQDTAAPRPPVPPYSRR